MENRFEQFSATACCEQDITNYIFANFLNTEQEPPLNEFSSIDVVMQGSDDIISAGVNDSPEGRCSTPTFDSVTCQGMIPGDSAQAVLRWNE